MYYTLTLACNRKSCTAIVVLVYLHFSVAQLTLYMYMYAYAMRNIVHCHDHRLTWLLVQAQSGLA